MDKNFCLFKEELKMSKKKPKIDKVFNYLKKGKSLTVKEAYNKWGVKNLPAVIHKLRKEHMDVRTEKFTKNGKVYSKYILE